MSARHWLAILSTSRLLNDSLTETWWCLPHGAQVGDHLLLYCTAKASRIRRGIFAESIVTAAPCEDCPDNLLCKQYGRGKLRYAGITISERFATPLTAERMRMDPYLDASTMMRRSFQATNFSLTSREYAQIKSLLSQLNP